jgi:hypothetical protein
MIPEDTSASPLEDLDHQNHVDGGPLAPQNADHNFESTTGNNTQFPQSSSPEPPTLEMVTEEWSGLRHPLSSPSHITLDCWNACPFVKLGWFTAHEAVTYVDLFFQNMNTLSPILSHYYHAHSNHDVLVSRDPVLCCTIITLSSRYHLLAGEGGLSRGFQIHDRMWKHCQSLFHRVVWGQRWTAKDELRALGTIESFLLVVEWHPRSIHLPVDLDSWDSEPIGLENAEGFRIGKGAFLPLFDCVPLLMIR